MDILIYADDPCLEQYEFSLYKEKGKLKSLSEGLAGFDKFR